MAHKTVNTVTGPVSTDALGITEMHEHIVVGLPGWEGDASIGPFNKEEIADSSVALFKELKEIRLSTFVDATTNDLGRCPELYREISERSGVQIICATGFFNEHMGSSAYWKVRSAVHDIAQELYELFMQELTVGIGGTDIKAGVIKVGSSAGKITEYETAVFQAAAKAHIKAGVPIITHTDKGTLGPEQAKLLLEYGANPKQIQIGHMSDQLDISYQLRTMEQGVYIAWDRMGCQGLFEGCPMDEERYPVLVDLIKRGHADQLIISQDSVLNLLGRPRKLPEKTIALRKNWNPFHLFKNIIPIMKKQGVTEGQITTIIEDNPRRLFEGS